MRQHYPASFKAQVVLEMLKERKTVAELASEYGVHPMVLQRWRRQALDNLPEVFADGEKLEAIKASYEKRIEELYTEIGRLTAQLAWLKKVSTLTRAERIALPEWVNSELPIKTQAELQTT